MKVPSYKTETKLYTFTRFLSMKFCTWSQALALCLPVQSLTKCWYKILKSKTDINLYGSLYVTLCFVLCPFDFDVLTIYFCMLSFLFVYNVAHF